MNYKAYTYRFLFLASISIVIIIGANASIDTRWITATDNTFNEKRSVFDERSQKTNFLIRQRPEFNNLILGSSRASYFPKNTLKGKWFNYAVSGMYPDEYLGYAEIAKQYATNHNLDTIIIGLDFWATCQCAIVEYKSPKLVYSDSKSWLRQASNLLSFDALNESYNTVKLNLFPEMNEAYYQLPSLAKSRTPSDGSTKADKLKEQLWYYRKDVFGEVYKFSTNYLVDLEELLERFPKTYFIFYVSPVSPELESLKSELGRTKDEAKWLEKLKTLDAELITLEPEKFRSEMFFDSHHLKPEYFRLIVTEIN